MAYAPDDRRWVICTPLPPSSSLIHGSDELYFWQLADQMGKGRINQTPEREMNKSSCMRRDIRYGMNEIDSLGRIDNETYSFATNECMKTEPDNWLCMVLRKFGIFQNSDDLIKVDLPWICNALILTLIFLLFFSHNTIKFTLSTTVYKNYRKKIRIMH